MSEYIYAWISVAVLAALAELMLPGGKSGKTAGHMRFLAGLCILAALIPTVVEGVERLQALSEEDLLGILSSEDIKADYEARFDEQLSTMTREQCETWVYAALEERFSVSREQCYVEAVVDVTDEGVPRILSVAVCLYGTAGLKDPHSIERYLSSQLSVPCTVAVDFDGV